MKKRSFVMGACGAALAPGLIGQAAAASTSIAPPAGAVRQDLPPLGEAPGRSAWDAYLHQPFVLQAASGPWPVVLDRISDLAAPPGHAQFVLGFSSPAQPPSGLYRLEHASGQALMIGLSASGAQAGARPRLRAEFNLLPG